MLPQNTDTLLECSKCPSDCPCHSLESHSETKLMQTHSLWTVYTTTNKEKNARKVIAKLLNEHSRLKVIGDINFQLYEKNDVIKASFKCSHIEQSWEKIVYELILMAQNISYDTHLIGNIDETVDLILNKICGGLGGISVIFICCVNSFL